MPDFSRYHDFPTAITVCDRAGTVVYMNPTALRQFSDRGESSLIGKSLHDCHSPDSNAIIESLMAEDRQNVYIVKKKGKTKIVQQTPWYEGEGADRRVGGLVEISFPVPDPLRVVDRG
jgi:transcriptional regulator with PAS, ATPase and Fis domain